VLAVDQIFGMESEKWWESQNNYALELTRTKKRVTSNAILPWISSLGIRKEVQLTTTKSELGK
jgi:plasmid maintenance system antidote protein VapI